MAEKLLLEPLPASDHWDADAVHLLAAFEEQPLGALLVAARARARATHGDVVTYSPKIFIPLTRLCR
ncbi:MAG: hypothetical protein JWN66_929, partial [Sphingomonas bacterium]|uniref:hypothetical protein n=1 Tax=Sphingomonas bacterium TaxID=1895847 RepID=UPI00262A7A56